MNNFIELSEDAFAALFKPVANHLNSDASFDWGNGYGTLFETYGDELAYVQSQPHETIWTLLSGDGDCVTSGFHFVNRLGYFVTNVAVPEGVEILVTLPEISDEVDGEPPPRSVSESLWTVVNYLRADEQRHYLESDAAQSNNINQSLDIIQEWLETL